MKVKETLEKAAEQYRKTTSNNMYLEKTAFIAGAEWQQKKMFTEEQLAIAMLDFGLYIAENRGKPIDTDNKIKEIIEQFKQQEQ
jgi:hypothetical protein